MWGGARRRRWVAERARAVGGKRRSSRGGGGRRKGRVGVGVVERGRLGGVGWGGSRRGRGWSRTLLHQRGIISSINYIEN